MRFDLGNTLGNLNIKSLSNNNNYFTPTTNIESPQLIEYQNGNNMLDMSAMDDLIVDNFKQQNDRRLPFISKKLINSFQNFEPPNYDVPSTLGGNRNITTNIGSNINKNKKIMALNSTAQKYLGKKYIWGTKVGSKDGADCSALTAYYAKNTGIQLPRTAYAQYKWFKKNGKLVKDITNADVGDLIYFDFKNSNGNPIGHTAIIKSIDNNGIKVIEASGGKGKVVERYLPKSYYKHIAGIGKL